MEASFLPIVGCAILLAAQILISAARSLAAGRRCRRCGQPIVLIQEQIDAAREYVAGCRTYRCVYCLKVSRERFAYGPACGLPI